MTVAFERENVRGDAVEGASDRNFMMAARPANPSAPLQVRSVSTSRSGGLVEGQRVSWTWHLGEVHAVRSPEATDPPLLLVRAFGGEVRAVGASSSRLPSLNDAPAGDLFPHVLLPSSVSRD
jgi:hypothetical protein